MSNWIRIGNRAINLDLVQDVVPGQTMRANRQMPCINLYANGGDVIATLVEPEASEFAVTFANYTNIRLTLLEVP